MKIIYSLALAALVTACVENGRPARNSSRLESFCRSVDPVGRPTDVGAIIDFASAETRTPTGILYGHWRTESGVTYGDRGGAGGCSARNQYLIMRRWKPAWGQANLDALERIARVTGRKADGIEGSCGSSTMERRGDSFGGALGPMQILAANWVKDPEFAGQDPFSLCWTMLWAGRRDQRYQAAAPATFRGDDYRRWEYAVRSYYGSLEHEKSPTYYRSAVRHWQEWHRAKSAGAHFAMIQAAAGRKARTQSRLASR